jgi:hypothetical protein
MSYDTNACSPWPHLPAPLRANLLTLLLGTVFSLCLFNTLAKAAVLEAEIEALQALDQASAEIKARRFDRAEILLERVLMLQPENAEARIELALLMATRGQQDSARALVQSLIDDPRTELAQAQELNNLLILIQKGNPAAFGINPYSLNPPSRPLPSWLGTNGLALPGAKGRDDLAQWRGEVNIGHTTNPLARTSAESITITLPDGPLSLPLVQGAHSGLVMGTQISRVSDSSGAELAVQGTNVEGASTAARATAWGRLPTAQFVSTQRLPAMLVYAQIQRGLDGQHRLQGGLSAISGQQKYSLSSYHEINTHDRGLTWRVDHQQPQWHGTDWYATLERSKSSIGPQGYWRFALTGEYLVNDRSKFLVQWTRQDDTYEYSALLENGAKRYMGVANVAYEQRYDAGNGKVFMWRVFTGERQSNLALFNYKETGLQISMVKKWQ